MHRHTGSGHKSAEDEAHSFASAFLMPRADLLAHIPRVKSLNDLIDAKRRWRVSTAALAYALHKIGLITDWHYRSYCIELNRFGRAHEPNGIDAETSQVWTKILTSLWREGTSLRHIAVDLAIPERELSNLLFGIAAPLAAIPKGGGLRLVK
jgi:Zn-dependent peptidase ImmA (M78 family)